MAAIAAIGLAVNVAVGLMLARGAPRDLNVRAALLHVGGDALGALAVIVGGVADRADRRGLDRSARSRCSSPAIIVAGVVGIVREATDVLLESAPDHAEVPAVRERIGRVAGVVGVHDLHVWTIGSGRTRSRRTSCSTTAS